MRVHTSATRGGLIPLLGALALASCTGSVPAPIAVIAGSAQTVNTGDFVQLDGSGSSDPQNRAITFSWSFAKRPLGSQISLIDASSPRASFRADAPGEFVVELTVSNSLLVSAPARMTVTVADCGAHAPTVNATATPSTTKPTGVVQLTATASDADNACGLTQSLTVRWALDTRPQGSTALPTSNTLATTSFTPDKPGNYEFSVIATDSTGRSSQPATVIVTATTCSEDLPGVGSISISSGGAKVLGTAITLQANNVTDTNCLSTGSPQLQWSLTVPAGSRAALDNVFGNAPTFLPEVSGAYFVSVRARNSEGKTSDTVFLTINVAACSPAPLQRPTILGIAATQVDPDGGPLLGTSANPIPHVGTTVTLIPDGVVAAYCGAIPTTPLSYSWTITQRPAGSQAQLDSSVATSPTFTPDKVGHYQFAAVAKDAFGNSSASRTFAFDTSACGTNPLTVAVTRGDGSPVPANLLTNTPEALLAGATAIDNVTCPARFAVNVAAATFSFVQVFGLATATISQTSLGSAAATFTTAEVGVYAIQVTASAGGHTGTAVVTQSAFLNPVPPVITAPPFATVGTSVTATTPARANMIYGWTVNGAAVASSILAGNSTVTATATADLTFVVTENSIAVTKSATSAPTLVRAAPVPASPTVIAPATATDGMPYTASAAARTGMTYAWSVGAGGAITSPGGALGVFSGGGTQTSITFTGSVLQSPLRIMLTEVNQAGDAASGPADVTIIARANAPTVSLAAAFVTAGRTITSTVTGRAGAPFACTVTGGSFIGAGSGTLDGMIGAASFTITAGAPGILQVSCTQQDAAGTASPSGTATATVAPTATPPNISAPRTVTASRSYVAFISARSGMTYQWTLDSGFIESVGGSAGELSADGRTNSIRFNAGPVGTIHLSVKETNQAGDSFATSTTTIAVVSQSLSPVITAPSNVTATRSYIATVPARADFTYAWEINNGAPDLTADTTHDPVGLNVFHFKPSIAGANGTTATMTLSVTETNAAGDSSASSTRGATVFPNPIAPTITITDAHGSTLLDGAGVTAGDALHATISPQAGITFAWTGTNTNPLAQAGGTTFDFTGTNTDAVGNSVAAALSVVATNFIGDTATSATRTLAVFPLPADPTIALATSVGTSVLSGADVTAGSFQATTNTQKSTITYQWTITPAVNRANVTSDTTTNVHFDALANADNTDATVDVTIAVQNAMGRMKTALATLVVHPAPQTPTIHIVGPDGNDNAVTQGATAVRAQVDARTHFHYVWTYAFADGAGISPGMLTNPGGTAGDLTTDGLHNFVLLTVPAGATHIRLTSTELNDFGVASAAAKLQATAVPAPVISTFTASSPVILFNDSSELTPTFTGSTGTGACGQPNSACIDHGIGSVASGLAVSTGPLTGTTTFTLTVINPAGTSTVASATVTVNAWVSLNNTAGQIDAGNPDTTTVNPTGLAIDALATTTPTAYLSSRDAGVLSSNAGTPPWVDAGTDSSATVAVARSSDAGLSVWATGACAGEVWNSANGTSWVAIVNRGLPALRCLDGGVLGNDLKVDLSDNSQNTVWVSFEGDGVFVSRDNGATWTSDSPPTVVDVSAIAILDAGTVFAATRAADVWFRPGALDAGWTKLADTPDAGLEPLSIASLTVWSQPSTGAIRLLKGGTDGVLVGGSVNLTAATLDVTVATSPGSMTDTVRTTYVPGSDKAVYVVAGNRLFRSIDQGATSDREFRLNLSVTGVYHSIIPHPTIAMRLYAIGTPGIFSLDLP